MTKSERISICKACEHFTSSGTCGRPVIGEWVTIDGEKVHLCGCFMHVKASIPWMDCPLNKWGEPDSDELDWLRQIDSKSAITQAEQDAILELIKNHTGEDLKATQCPSCLKGYIKKAITYFEKSKNN